MRRFDIPATISTMTTAAPDKPLEAAPPGWEGTVKGMKAHPEIGNPFALAWYMADKGDQPKEDAGEDAGLQLIKKWEDFEKSPEYQAYAEKHPAPAAEANAASATGQLFKPHKPQESKKTKVALLVRFREASAPNDATREIPVVLISEGFGNPVDGHFYSGALLDKSAALFDGVKAYANHPSKTQEQDRPERDIREIVGFYHTPQVAVVEGKKRLTAVLKIFDGPTYQWAWDLAKEAQKFAERYADKDLVGLSINAYGVSHQEEVLGKAANVVDAFVDVGSVDMVTQAGAGGGFRLRESIKSILAPARESEGGVPMKDTLAKHGQALAQLHGSIKANPEHEKAYGPAMEELMKSHSALTNEYEGMGGGGAPEAGADAADAAGDDSVEEAFKKEDARFKAGKMSEAEANVFKLILRQRTEQAIKENARMVAASIKESGIPEAYAGDLAAVCAGKSEADVKKIVETRKALVAPILSGKAVGAGAGSGEGSGKKSELGAKIAECGVKMKEQAKA